MRAGFEICLIDLGLMKPKRALAVIGLLAVALVVALFLRVRHLRAAAHGPAGGTGVIEGVDVGVQSRLATRILAVKVREGDTVKQGDLLVELDCSEAEAVLEQARSQLRAAEASVAVSKASAQSVGRNAQAASGTVRAAKSQLTALVAQQDLARLELSRTEGLVKSGALPQASLDAAQSRYDTVTAQVAAQTAAEGASRDQAAALSTQGVAAKSQIDAAVENVGVARAGVSRAEVATRECKLVAPRDGMVASRNYEPGEAVLPGMTLLTITDLTEATARFYLPNDALAAAAPGKPVHVVADAYPGESFEGTISYVSPRAELTPRNVQTREDRQRLVYAVEVRVPNGSGKLRSGMPVEVTIDGSYQ